MNNGEDEGRGTTTAFLGERVFTFSFVADSSSGPAASKIDALMPQLPGFSCLQDSFLFKQENERKMVSLID